MKRDFRNSTYGAWYLIRRNDRGRTAQARGTIRVKIKETEARNTIVVSRKSCRIRGLSGGQNGKPA